MANQAFSTVASNPLKAQPVAAGVVIVRSTNVSDDANLDIYGTVSASPDSETIGMSGLQEASTTAEFSALSQAILASVAVGTVTARADGVAAVGDVRVDVVPTDGDTLTVGFVDALTVYRWKNTMAAAYDVKIGATIQNCAANLSAAINAGAGSGTAYYAGTLANPFVSAAVSVAVVTLTDRIKCQRQLAWVLTESGANFSKRVPTAGADGLLLFSIPAGSTSAANALTFSTEDHSTVTLPALMLGTSPAVTISGGACMVRLWADNSIVWKLQSSTDLVNWVDWPEGNETLSASTRTVVTPAELQEYVRFVIVTNSNTGGTKLDARIIF